MADILLPPGGPTAAKFPGAGGPRPKVLVLLSCDFSISLLDACSIAEKEKLEKMFRTERKRKIQTKNAILS